MVVALRDRPALARLLPMGLVDAGLRRLDATDPSLRGFAARPLRMTGTATRRGSTVR